MDFAVNVTCIHSSVQSKSSVDDTAAAAEISRLQEENRNLQVDYPIYVLDNE